MNYEFSSTSIKIFDISYMPLSERFSFLGRDLSTESYMASSPFQAFEDHPDIIASTFSMSATSISSYALTSIVYLGASSAYASTVNVLTMNTYTFSFADTEDTCEDANYYFLPYTESNLMENWQKNSSIDVTCSLAGTMTFTYSLVAHGIEPIPTWVTYDDVNNQLQMNLPTIPMSSTFHFYIQAQKTGSTVVYLKFITLNVIDCFVVNCYK